MAWELLLVSLSYTYFVRAYVFVGSHGEKYVAESKNCYHELESARSWLYTVLRCSSTGYLFCCKWQPYRGGLLMPCRVIGRIRTPCDHTMAYMLYKFPKLLSQTVDVIPYFLTVVAESKDCQRMFVVFGVDTMGVC